MLQRKGMDEEVNSVDIIKEREILQKCLCASVGKEKCKKITEQFILN